MNGRKERISKDFEIFFLDGIYIQIKNVSIFISTRAGDLKNIIFNLSVFIIWNIPSESCKACTRFRGVLIKLKAKAVKLVSEINTKKESQNCPLSMEDFEKGIFPSDFNSDDQEEKKSFAYRKVTNQSLSPNNWRIEIHTAKWRWKRILCILCQLVLHWTKPHLDDVSYGQTNTKFIAGKAVLSRSEIAQLDKKIQECLLIFQLYSKNDNYRFSQNECEYEQTQDSEFDSQDVDESFYDESSGSKDSEETDYENDSQFSDSESDWMSCNDFLQQKILCLYLP